MIDATSDRVRLINADSLEYIRTLPDDCIDLICTDPPYFKVKEQGWDNQWRTDADYLLWLDLYLVEFRRVLKPAGGLYIFCGHRLAADIEILIRNRFNILNSIIWAKPSGHWQGCHKEDLRCYFPSTERVIFAEQYLGPYSGKDDNYETKCCALKGQIMAPLIDYFRDARESLGITAKQIIEVTGKKNMVSHWFSGSQWQLPNETDYQKLQALFDAVAREKRLRSVLSEPISQLRENYQVLNIQYHELSAEFKSLRRPFTVSAVVPYTDVWTYKPVQFYPGKHPCEKPSAMMRDIVQASSKPGDVVADFFMGSGSMIKEALKLGRIAIGVELEAERFEQTRAEIQRLLDSLA